VNVSTGAGFQGFLWAGSHPIRRNHRLQRRLIRLRQAGLTRARRCKCGHGVDQLLHPTGLERLAVRQMKALDLLAWAGIPAIDREAVGRADDRQFKVGAHTPQPQLIFGHARHHIEPVDAAGVAQRIRALVTAPHVNVIRGGRRVVDGVGAQATDVAVVARTTEQRVSPHAAVKRVVSARALDGASAVPALGSGSNRRACG